ncbi:hypothetical protein OZD66_05915, partial [Wolbachia endosymbiont of Drosophila baimaii]|nr:hypothetical protein [Wolbachia endosymbiont of Drosophila baimaii]
ITICCWHSTSLSSSILILSHPDFYEKSYTLTIKHLKNFYDGLINSINKYDENMDSAIQSGIITQLSSTIDSIGSKTSSIDSELADLRNSIPDIGEAPPLLHITGEENGLL